MPFLTTELEVSTCDGHNFRLLTRLDYIANNGIHYRALAGTTTDGLSTPRAIWNLIPPFAAFFSGVLHDAGYRGTLVVVHDDGHQSVPNLTRPEIDLLLLEAMQAQGLTDTDCYTVYQAVKLAGEVAFEKDLSEPLPPGLGPHAGS